jgi:chemotaxis protein methyltransferase CheR
MSGARKLRQVGISQLFSDSEFEELGRLFVELTGNKLGKDKRNLLESRLSKRLLETGLSPSALLERVKRDAIERELFISVLTTHKTDWFRESVHLDFLTQTIESVGKPRKAHPLLIWSAACSSGEEVYSICMALLSSGTSDFRILGSDISESCLEKARSGTYGIDQVNLQVPLTLKTRFFIRSDLKAGSPCYQVQPMLMEHIKWRKFNLKGGSLPGEVRFDFIFIRNVLIYFHAHDIDLIIRNICRYLKPGGFLITGLSENITTENHLNLRRVGNSIYRHER